MTSWVDADLSESRRTKLRTGRVGNKTSSHLDLVLACYLLFFDFWDSSEPWSGSLEKVESVSIAHESFSLLKKSLEPFFLLLLSPQPSSDSIYFLSSHLTSALNKQSLKLINTLRIDDGFQRWVLLIIIVVSTDLPSQRLTESSLVSPHDNFWTQWEIRSP